MNVVKDSYFNYHEENYRGAPISAGDPFHRQHPPADIADAFPCHHPRAH